METFAPHFDGLKEILLRCTTIEIAIVRDLLLKVFPDIFSSGAGINAALVSPPDEDAQGEHKTDLPPDGALEDDSDVVDVDKAMSEEELMAAVRDRLPFSDDIEVHDVFSEPRADDVVVTFIETLPEGITVSTKNTAYVNHILSVLFTKMYREDHCIPKKDTDFTESIVPPLPKGLIGFLHNLAVHKANEYKDDFDIETFWRMVRQNFAVATYAAPATKPTASDLLMQGRVVVTTEDLLSKLRKTHTRDSYNKFVSELLEGQSPGAVAQDPVVTDAPMDEALNITRLHLKRKVAEAKEMTADALSRSGSRKRTAEVETTITKEVVKKTKK